MFFLLFILIISGCSADTNQKASGKKSKNNHAKTTIIDKAEKLPKSIKESDIAMEQMGNADADFYTDEEIIEMVSTIISGKVTEVSSYVTQGAITTVANVKVTDSIKGTLKKGDNISVELMGGYAKIEQMIESYPKEEQEEIRKNEYSAFTDEEIKNKYIHEFHMGDAELKEGMEGIFSLMLSKDNPNIYYTPQYFGDVYLKLPNGEYRQPNTRPYERLAELSKIPDEEKAKQISRDEDGYVDSFKVDLITYEELMEKINSIINK